MSVRTTLAHLRARIPFGIGTVSMIAIAALVACAGIVLAIGTPESSTTHDFGRLRPYQQAPEVAWSQSSETLPDYTSDGSIEVVGTHADQWLLSYPSGIGRAYLAVDRLTGKPSWEHPVRAGLGSCAVNSDGEIGCAIKVSGQLPDGFYLINDHGVAGAPSDLAETATVVAVGPNFLRITQSGYRVTMQTPAGDELWSRTFAATAKAEITENQLLQISTNDASEFIVDPTSGKDRLSCSQCAITSYPTGIAVTYTETSDRHVDTYAVTNGTLDTQRVARSTGLRVLPGSATQAVLTAIGDAEMQATQGRYEIRDPAENSALWSITDPELSKANARPCGSMVAFALKDRSRVVYNLSDGQRVGALPEPGVGDPANIDQLACVGSAGNNRLIFADRNQISAFDPTTSARSATTGGTPGVSTPVWTYPIIGNTEVIDGYIVAVQGTTLSVLQPN